MTDIHVELRVQGTGNTLFNVSGLKTITGHVESEVGLNAFAISTWNEIVLLGSSYP